MADRKQRIQEIFKRRVEQIFPSSEHAQTRLLEQDALSVYLGIDPTAPSLHLGHTVALLFLKEIQELGHKPVIVMGDFTARIGDPTDKLAVRTTLSKEEVTKNMEHYLEQVEKILKPGTFEVRYNSEWLTSMTLENVIGLASGVTVQQMLARDMFQERIKQEKPIFIHEFLYPLMQGYDSVAMKIDGEVGGNDQTFNMLVGRDLEKQLLGKDKLVFALRLLVDSGSGRKMSKSEGNAISLNDEPQEIRRKVLALDDGAIKTVFELGTEKDSAWIEEHTKGAPRIFKEELAEELVRLYHGGEAVAQAKQAKRASGRVGLPIDQVLVAEGVAGTISAAKRLIEQGGVTINNEPVENWKQKVKKGDAIRAGKGKFIEIES